MRGLLHYFLALISLISLVSLLPAIAQASTPPAYQYLAEKKFQPDPLNHPNIYCNYANEEWANNYWVHTVKWWADSQPRDGINLRDQVAWVYNNYHLMVGELHLEETTQSQADVQFTWEANLQEGDAGGHLITEYWLLSPQMAYYPKKVNIMLHQDATNKWDSALAVREGLAHEIGHLYGLADRYYTNPVDCIGNESTVMDSMFYYVSGGVNHWYASCDTLAGPDQIDHTRIDNFWSLGSLENLSVSANGAIATWTWKDGAWAEWDHLQQVFYWNGSGWTCYYNVNGLTNIGTQKSYDDRTLSLTIDHRNYGVPGGSQCLCGMSWFKEFNKYGSWQCQSVYVSP